MITEKSCGAVLFRRTAEEPEFLAIKESHSGQWGFPKGHIEAGESERATALREIREETGITVPLHDGFRETTEYPLSEGNSKEVVFFMGDATGCTVTIRQGEITDYTWLGYRDMMDRLSFENNRLILSKANEFIVKSI